MQSLACLANFPPPPDDDLITVCEWENQLIALPPRANTRQYTEKISNYPKVTVPGAMLTTHMSKEGARDAFIQQNASTWTRACSAWHERGLRGLLEEIATEKERDGAGLLPMVTHGLLSILDWITSIPGAIFPFWQLPSEEVIAEFSAVANWHESIIRSFAWHPWGTKFAVAFRDDSIRVYSTKTSVVPTLKHKSQKGIADMAWMPYSTSILTIACEKCILVWQVDPTSLITRPPASCVQVFEYSGHSPITSISWNPLGILVISASPKDSRMRVWDIGLEESEAILRRSPGVSMVRWSPDSAFVFSASPASEFKIWETETWTCETWTTIAGHCQAACWHPSSSVLLFATKNEPIIYGLNFPATRCAEQGGPSGIESVQTVANVAAVTFQTENDSIDIGGCIQNMDWDPTGERLAVTFFKKAGGRKTQRYIAVFRTRIQPLLELTPCGFIAGELNEIPQLISFQKKYDESGSLLAVCWTNQMTGSGRVAYIPMHFLPSSSLGPKAMFVSSPYVRSPYV